VSHGYFEARSLAYLQGATNALLEWLRLPGDAVFILGGILPLIYLCWLSLRHVVPPVSAKKAEATLFTEITEMAERQP
jgi:nitric oxide reductase subunit B